MTKIGEGMPVSSGVAKGNAVVVVSSKEFMKLEGKEAVILVVKNFDPNYDILLPKCQGIISEIGNLLCHLAIVARVRKIPAIVNCMNATSLIKDGDPLTIDGFTGTIFSSVGKSEEETPDTNDLFDSFKKLVLDEEGR